MRLRRRYKTGLFYERTYPLPFHFYERFSTSRSFVRSEEALAEPQPSLRPRQARSSRIFANPSPASGRDKRGPPVSSQNRKDSPVFWNTTLPYLRKTPAQPPAATSAALPYLRKTAKIRRFSGTRPSHIFEKPQRFVGFREGRVCRGREGGGRTRGSASLPGAASGG